MNYGFTGPEWKLNIVDHSSDVHVALLSQCKVKTHLNLNVFSKK